MVSHYDTVLVVHDWKFQDSLEVFLFMFVVQIVDVKMEELAWQNRKYADVQQGLLVQNVNMVGSSHSSFMEMTIACRLGWVQEKLLISELKCCRSWGSPHYNGMDKEGKSLVGRCDHLLSGTCWEMDGIDLMGFNVTLTQYGAKDHPELSFLRVVTVHHDGHLIEFLNNEIRVCCLLWRHNTSVSSCKVS